jgi:hypothetical protein
MEMIRNNHIALSVRKSFTSGPADVLLKKMVAKKLYKI